MTNSGTENYSKMFNHFIQLNYLNKLNYFHAHFGIIPFSFPEFDTEISWYNNLNKVTLLTENFYKERPKKFICERTFIDGCSVIKFNVQPVSPVQRIQFNRFIIFAFLEYNNFLKKKIDNDLLIADDPIKFLTSQITILTSIQEWIQYSIEQSKQKINLRNQFLHILFNGLNFYYSGKEITIQQRRKFVELYLFSQGIFFADYLSTLKLLLKKKQNHYSNFL